MNASKAWLSVCVLIALMAGTVNAVNIETVTVGNPGNVGELSGSGAGGSGPDRICGSVAYTYNIGKYEVTAGQYTEFLNAVAATDTYWLYNTDMWSSIYGCKIQRSGTSGSYTYSVATDCANRPVNYVSWGDAARFANWLHNGQPTGAQDLSTTEDGAYYLSGGTSNAALLAVNRKSTWKWAITNEDEWYKAAYYNPATSDYYDYPTSSDAAPGQDMADVSGNSANYATPYADPIQSPYYTTMAGEFQNSDSPYGTFDQGGNVSEWNETLLYSVSRGWRGGGFYSTSIQLHASDRSPFPPSLGTYEIGFRVVQVPEPAMLGLMALAGVGFIRRR